MNIRTFRMLVLLYVAISIGGSILNQKYLFWLIPDEIIGTWNAYNTFIFDLRDLPSMVNIGQILINLLLSIYGTFGLIFCWRYSREVFFISTFPLSIVMIFMATSHLTHAGALALDYLEWSLAGAIMCASYFTPIKEKF